MKLFVYADPHWSRTSSIVRGNGKKYSVRLENLIETIQWVENTAVEQNSDAVVCLGDFFDSVHITAEEMTALTEIDFANIKHYFLVGNHETNSIDNSNNIVNIFSFLKNYEVISEPQKLNISQDTEMCFLPYIHPSEQKTIFEYFGDGAKNRYIFSHNDIKGVQYGPAVSTIGFDMDDIMQNCSLFINGHIHNYSKYRKIINLGNITGQNFGEDALKYGHFAMILDTDSGDFNLVENPFAMKFYKIDSISDLNDIDMKNAVLSVVCHEDEISAVNSVLTNSSAIAYKMSLIATQKEIKRIESVVRDSKSPYEKFYEYIISKIGENDIVKSELSEVIK